VNLSDVCPIAPRQQIVTIKAPGKITIETANSFRHVITRPLNEMIFNSLYFAVIQVKTIRPPRFFAREERMIYAVFWQTRLGKKVSFGCFGKAAALRCWL
jgi:hypothetical protein